MNRSESRCMEISLWQNFDGCALQFVYVWDIIGQLRELEQSLETLEKQLSDPLYKEASSKWVRMVAEWKANKLACADLG